MKKIKTVWHDSYFQPTAASWLSTRKQKDVVAGASNLIVMAGADSLVEPSPEVWASIARIHDPAYVEAVRTGEPRHLAQSQGFKWSREWADSVARIWAGQTEAAKIALEEGISFHPASGAHHAERSTGGGFCTFNYLVGAAKDVLAMGVEKVLICDLDTHQGNGVFDLVDDPRIVQFDISGCNFGVRPQEHLEGGIFYRCVDTHEEYFEALDNLTTYLDYHKPGLVLFQAGMDCHEQDMGPVEGLNAERLIERDLFVFRECKRRGIPVAFNLAGGYIKGGLTVQLHVNTVRAATEVYGR
jgi:acetoin utilization deacetylase AcuC-like enzyme